MPRVTMLLDNDLTRDGRVQKEARSLVGAGYEVTVVAVRTPGSEPEDEIAGARVIRLPPAPFSDARGFDRVGTVYRWYERMAPLGITAAAIPADVVHAHDLTTLAPARRAARRLGAALVFDDHELYVETLNTSYPPGGGLARRLFFFWMERRLRRAGNRVERAAIPDLAGHVTVSEPLADEIARRFSCDRPTVVMNGPPLVPRPRPDGRLRRAFGAGPDARVVLFVGTMPVVGIGLEDLVDAVAKLPEDVLVALVGWGSGRPALERRAAERGVADRVRFLPPVAPEEVPAWYADADVSAVVNLPTNLSNLYGLPNKLFESMMAGCPVVAADSPAIRDVIRAYPAGRLYAMGDAADLAGKIREVLDAGAEGREAFAAAGRRGVTERYAWEHQEARLLRMYAEIAVRIRT